MAAMDKGGGRPVVEEGEGGHVEKQRWREGGGEEGESRWMRRGGKEVASREDSAAW